MEHLTWRDLIETLCKNKIDYVQACKDISSELAEHFIDWGD